MKFKTLLTSGSIATAVAASMVLFASPAQAQNTCDLDGTDAGDNAADANDGATATGTDALACGGGATADQAGGVALGTNATATGPNGVNPIFASVAIGYNTVAQDNAVAIGNSAQARFGGTANPIAVGINSAVAAGAGAVAVGANTVAIGTTSRAGTGFAVNTPGAPVNAGSNITVVGGRAEANQNGATAVGANSEITAVDGTALGQNTEVSQAGGIAIGSGARALGPSPTNTLFASTAVGFNAIALDNASAFGNSAVARFSGSFTPTQPGTNSAVAMGTNAVAIGSNTVAIGTTTRAGTGFAFDTPGAEVFSGSNITVVGGRAEANTNGATAIGANSNVSGANGTALGQNTVVTADNAVAIGNGSVADQTNTVSVGAVGSERRIVNVAAGTGATDAVNVSQLNAAIGGVAGSAATAQTTADTALANAATAQATANSAVAQNTVQDGQIAAIQVLNNTQNSRLTALETLSLGAIPALQALTATHSTQIAELFALTDRDRRQARRGTATALALTAAPMPSTPGGIGYAFNVSNYRSEQALGLSIAVRTNGDKPFAITAGASYAGNKDIGARVGVAGEF